MTKDTFILLAQPEQLRQLQGWDAVPAHLAYRIGRGPHLFRAGSGPVPQGLSLIHILVLELMAQRNRLSRPSHHRPHRHHRRHHHNP